MNSFIESIYLAEITTQCKNAVGAVRSMNELLKAKQPAEFFREAADFLRHAACVSRLLWPAPKGNVWQRTRALARGEHLRKALGLGDAHVLRTRTLRDHLEHYDERIDDWAENSPNKNIVDNMIGPRNAIGGDAIKDTDIMRSFDPATRLFIFRGEPFEIQALVNGVEDILNKATKRQADIDPWRRPGVAA